MENVLWTFNKWLLFSLLCESEATFVSMIKLICKL